MNADGLNNTSWRKNWFVINVLSEIPIIGSFFEKDTWALRIHAAAKCAAMLLGGSIGMTNSFPELNEHHTTEYVLKMTAGMALGMMAGKVAFNTLFSSVKMLHHYTFMQNNHERLSSFQEMQQLSHEANIEARLSNTSGAALQLG